MIRNLTGLLRAAVEQADTWFAALAHDLAHRLHRGVLGSPPDWDEEAGEDWVRSLLDGEAAAIVSVAVPVVFYRLEIASVVRAEASPTLVAIEVADWDGARYLVTDTTVVLPRRKEWSPNVDPAAFSINELWWMTV